MTLFALGRKKVEWFLESRLDDAKANVNKGYNDSADRPEHGLFLVSIVLFRSRTSLCYIEQFPINLLYFNIVS